MDSYPEYDSPFNVIFQKIVDESAKEIDDMCEIALLKAEVEVDKDKLIEVLRQDSTRYREAYRRGYETAKSQIAEPVEAEIEGGGSNWWYVCGECHGAIDRADQYCRHCGRKVMTE